ncbi:hypothetical protein KKE14_01530 [Patescibacteria group bacterium]|nr:hypothetical protein [Patescibacteria group bacterium]
MEKAILYRIENQVRQRLFGAVTLLVLGLMLVNSFSFVRAQTSDITNLSFNITAGDFYIMNAPVAINFASQAFGVGNNITGDTEIDSVAVKDYRGNNNVWDVTAAANNFLDGNLMADDINMFANAGTIANVENGDLNRVAVGGGTGNLGGAGSTLFNGSTQASGVFRYDNGFLNLRVDGDEPAGTYTATMTYTLA